MVTQPTQEQTTPQGGLFESALGRWFSKWSDGRIARRIAEINKTVPGLIEDAMTEYDAGKRDETGNFWYCVLPYDGLSDHGVQSFGRMAVMSSKSIDEIMAGMRETHPEWYVHGNCHGRNRAYNKICVHRKAYLLERLA